MAQNNLSALVKLAVDKAQARIEINKSLKEIQKDIEIETGVKVRLTDIKKAQKELDNTSKEAGKLVTELSRLSKAETLQKWADNNSKAMKKHGRDINKIIERYRELDSTMDKIESDKLSAEFKQIQDSARKTGDLGKTAIDKIKDAVEKFGGWSLVTGAMMKLWHSFEEGVEFAYSLDDALTDVAYTSNTSQSQLEDLGESAINMAKDLNTSAKNILEAVKIYSTANATAEDILRKSQPAIMLSNISDMSGSESSKTINTSLNQFELEDTVEGLLDITDTLQYVSSQLNYDFTEGIKEITEGIEASGSVAKNAGLSMQEYATMVGVAVEKTGQSGSTIGNAYKTIFSRITKASSTEGTLESDISAAEKALRSVGVEVRDSAEEFRDLTDIMADLGEVWDSLSTVEKSNIGFQVAGTRQLNVLNSLFGAWDSYSAIMSDIDERAGTTLKNQETYADSLAGHLGDLYAVGESVWSNIIESQTIKTGIDLLTGLLSVVDELTESLGTLGTIGLGGGILAGLKNVGKPKMYGFVKYADNYKCSLGY